MWGRRVGREGAAIYGMPVFTNAFFLSVKSTKIDYSRVGDTPPCRQLVGVSSFAADKTLVNGFERPFALAIVLPSRALGDQDRYGSDRETLRVQAVAHLAPDERHRDRSPRPRA